MFSNQTDYIWLHLMEYKMKKFALVSMVACFVAGCQAKSEVPAEDSASAVVSASAAPSAAPTASATVAASAEAVPSASAVVAPEKK